MEVFLIATSDVTFLLSGKRNFHHEPGCIYLHYQRKACLLGRIHPRASWAAIGSQAAMACGSFDKALGYVTLALLTRFGVQAPITVMGLAGCTPHIRQLEDVELVLWLLMIMRN